MKSVIEKILDTKLKHLRRNCPKNITDLVFLEIEKSYLPSYENAIKYKGSDTINRFIGKYIRQYWNLNNLGRHNNPVSYLIKSYEKHSNF